MKEPDEMTFKPFRFSGVDILALYKKRFFFSVFHFSLEESLNLLFKQFSYSYTCKFAMYLPEV
jgi:hypothetical protein